MRDLLCFSFPRLSRYAAALTTLWIGSPSKKATFNRSGDPFKNFFRLFLRPQLAPERVVFSLEEFRSNRKGENDGLSSSQICRAGL